MNHSTKKWRSSLLGRDGSAVFNFRVQVVGKLFCEMRNFSDQSLITEATRSKMHKNFFPSTFLFRRTIASRQFGEFSRNVLPTTFHCIWQQMLLVGDDNLWAHNSITTQRHNNIFFQHFAEEIKETGNTQIVATTVQVAIWIHHLTTTITMIELSF